MKRLLKFLTPTMVLVWLLTSVVGLTGYASERDDSGFVDAMVVFADLHTNPLDGKAGTIRDLMEAAKGKIKGPVSTINSAGDAFSVCLDSGNSSDEDKLKKAPGYTSEINSIILDVFSDTNPQINYAWSDHDRYADVFYDYASDTVNEAAKSSGFCYGAGADGEYGTSDDDNYYIYFLSMADTAAPEIKEGMELITPDQYPDEPTYDETAIGTYDDRYFSGFHTAKQRNEAIKEFETIAGQLDDTKPLFIISHQPLFARRGDNDYAYAWAEKINAVAEEMDVALFFGHNHNHDNTLQNSYGAANTFPNDYYLPVGTTVSIATPNGLDSNARPGKDMTLNFSHVCAGYMSPTTSTDDDAKYTRRGVVMGVTIKQDEILYQTIGENGIYKGKNEVDTAVARKDNYVQGKDSYLTGEELDIQVIYNGEDVTGQAVIEGFDSSVVGEQVLQISYGTFKTFYKVAVGAKDYVDEETGVVGSLSEPAANTMKVYRLTANRYHAAIFYRMEGLLEYCFGYQVEMEKESKDGLYTVKLPIPAKVKNPAVYHMAENAYDYTRVEGTVEGNYYTFTASRLGIFMIGEDLLGEAPHNTIYGGTKTIYVPVDSFEDGGKYLLIGEKGEDGPQYLYHNGTDGNGALGIESGVTFDVSNDAVEGMDGSSYQEYIDVVDEYSVWTASGNSKDGFTLENNGCYISQITDSTNTLLDNNASNAKVLYDASNHRVYTAAEPASYLYYSVHEKTDSATGQTVKELWNWSDDIGSSTQSSRKMLICKAVEIPAGTDAYRINVDFNTIFCDYYGMANIYNTIVKNGEAIDESTLGGKWSIVGKDETYQSMFECVNDYKVRLKDAKSVCMIKLNYVWGENDENSLYRYVTVKPHNCVTDASHFIIGDFITNEETGEKAFSYRCIHCMREEFELKEEGVETGSVESESTADIGQIVFPQENESPNSLANTPFTADYNGNYYLSGTAWEAENNGAWEIVPLGESFTADKDYRLTVSLTARNGSVFASDISDDNVSINGDEATIVSLSEDGKEIVIQQNFNVGATKEDSEEKPEGKPEENPEVETGFRVEEVKDCTFTGNNICPEVQVYYGDELLKKGTDYTLTYGNNRNTNIKRNGEVVSKEGNGVFTSKDDAGYDSALPYVIVKGTGKYEGTVYVNFNILPLSIGSMDENSGFTVKYTAKTVEGNKKFKPFTALLHGEKVLEKDKDYEVYVYNQNMELVELKDGKMSAVAGKYLLAIFGKGNYRDYIWKEFEISLKEYAMKDAIISLPETIYYDTTDGLVTFDFGGEKPNAKVKIKDGNTTRVLTEGKDYTVEYSNNDCVGKASLTVTGMGQYKGSKSVSFNIKAVKLTSKKTIISNVADQVYTGSTICPQESISFKNADGTTTLLERDVHYTVSYKSNRKPGVATVTFTGKKSGGYTGTISKTFKITKATISEDMKMVIGPIADVVYEKNGARVDSELILVHNGTMLVKGKDYTLTYKGNKDLGDAEVTITGKGNFKGSFTEHFTVIPKPLSDVTITVAEQKYSSNPNKKYTVSVSVKDGKNTLKKGKDYEVILPEITKEVLDAWYAGETEAPMLTVKAKEGSFYAGEVQLPVNIYYRKLTINNAYMHFYQTDLGERFDVYYSDNANVIRSLRNVTDEENRKELLEQKLANNELSLLTSSKDYTADFEFTKTGVTITIKGIGGYSGSIKGKYYLSQATKLSAEMMK